MIIPELIPEPAEGLNLPGLMTPDPEAILRYTRDLQEAAATEVIDLLLQPEVEVLQQDLAA